MNHHGRFNPIRLLAALTGLCLLLGAVADPGLFRLDAPDATAVGGYAAESVIGPDDFTGDGTWEFTFDPEDPVVEFAYQYIEGEVIWAVTAGDGSSVYSCSTGTLCDEESDWVSYAMSNTLSSIAIDQDITHVVLYVGTGASTAEILRCDVGISGCDEESDWSPAFATDLTGGTDTADALISAGGFLFAGVNGAASSGPTTTFRCDITTDCDDTGDWTESLSSEGGRAWQFMFDEANSVLYLGRKDSSSTGHVKRCDLATGCDEDSDWGLNTFSQATPFHGLTMDEDNQVIYLAFSAAGEGPNEPGAIVRCDIVATDCNDQDELDWVEIDTGDVDITSITWEPVNGFLFAGSNSDLYRCDTATLCDDFSDFEFVSAEADQTVFVTDLVNEALFSGGTSVYRCELATGCGIMSELSEPADVMYDSANERVFVSDTLHNRVLVYDVSGGIVDGQAPVNVLGQDDFSGTDCNQGGSADAGTLCGPGRIDYDDNANELFVADSVNNRVLAYDVSLIVDGEDAIVVLGQPDFLETDCNQGGPADATTVCAPRHVNRDTSNNRLYVTDANNHRVLVYDLSGGISNGMAASNVLGQDDFASVDCNDLAVPAIDNLCVPEGLTYDGDGNRLFVADSSNARVLVYDVASITNGEDAVNVLGQENFDEGISETNQDSLGFSVADVEYDGDNSRIFVADRDNNRVMIWDVSSITDGQDAVDVIGQIDFDSNGAGVSAEALSAPSGVAGGGGMSVFVADLTNNRVLLFSVPPGAGSPTTGHEATDVVGQLHGDDTITFDYSGVNNSPNSRGFNGPEGVTIDAVNHRLFEVDPANHRVMVFDLDTGNALIDRIADHVLGQPDFRANGNGTSQSQMTYPQYPAYDPDNDLLFVSDYSNNRVMVFDVATIVDGEDAFRVLGQPDFDSTAVVLSDTGMSNPRGVAYDPSTSRLFVGSQDHQRVLVYDLGSGIANGMAASWVLGQEDFNSSGPNLDQDGLGAGNNLTLDVSGQRLFVDDSPFSRVMVWDISGTITNGEDAVNVIGQEDFFTGDPGLDQDSLDFSGLYGNGLAHDPDNERLFVADGSNRRIMVFDVATIDDGEDAVNVLGQTGFFSEDDSLSQSSTRAAAGLAYDADNGLLYTTTKGDTGQPNADNRSSIFDVNSIVNGEPAADLLGQLDENDEPFYTTRGVDNTPNQLGFNSAHGVTVDQVNHRLFTADFNNNRVLVFNLDEDNSPIDYAADFVIGQPDFKSTASAADDPQAYNFNNGPQSVAYHEENDWLIVNDANGNRVLIFDMAALANGMDALYVLGQPDFTTHNCCTVSDSEFVSSEGIALDTETNFLYVPDGVHNRVLVFDLSTVSNGMSASFVLGQPDFTTEDANTGPDGMSSPRGAAVDAVGQRLFISDNGNRRVLVFDTSVLSNGMAATNVLGQDDFFSSENEVSQSRTPDPAGLAYDSDRNRLFVSDPNTSRVMVFDTASITDGEDAVDAYGQATFTDSGCNTTRSGLCVPQAAFYDLVNDTLYVADAANNRVLIFGPTDTGGGDDGSPPTPVGFTPGRIIINQDDSTTDSRNVLVSVYATTTGNFTGIVDVLLSNTTDFNTFVPFRYVIPEMRDGRPTRDVWPKTIAWDLCFGITETTACSLGNKVVYARFYVNVPAPMPVLVPHDVLVER